MKFKELFDRLKDGNVLVIGDIMLDKYIFGDVSRISPEAPVQVVDVKKEDFTLGGAANACYNSQLLGTNVSVAGALGEDDAKVLILSKLKESGIGHSLVITDPSRKTTQKVRVMGMSQQLVRIDYEDRHYLSSALRNEFIRRINDELNGQDVIVISDYVKGLVHKDIVQSVIRSGKRVVVDPKPKHMDIYKGAYLVKPNLKEAKEMTGIEPTDERRIHEMGKHLRDHLGSNILITAGSKGMFLFELDRGVSKLPTKAREVYDVSGAGDTVIATIASCLAAGSTLKEACIIANYAAGIVVGKKGTAATNPQEILSLINGESQIA